MIMDLNDDEEQTDKRPSLEEVNLMKLELAGIKVSCL